MLLIFIFFMIIVYIWFLQKLIIINKKKRFELKEFLFSYLIKFSIYLFFHSIHKVIPKKNSLKKK